MKCCGIAVAGLALSSLSIGQTVVGLEGSDQLANLNHTFLAQRQGGTIKKGGPKDVVVFTGDRVIPQFVDGGSWKTSMFFVNLENHSVSFQVLFFDDGGNDMLVP